MSSELMVTEHIKENEYTWTLASRFGDMLDVAESFFGVRDKSYTLLGFEFWSGDHPIIRYSGNPTHIIIRLTERAQTDVREAYYELAQEIVHCLAPVPTDELPTNRLEEGVTMWFAHYYLKNKIGRSMPLPDENSPYRQAYDAVAPLLDNNPTCLKELRKQKKFIEIKREEVLSAFPQIPEGTVDYLLSGFKS